MNQQQYIAELARRDEMLGHARTALASMKEELEALSTPPLSHGVFIRMCATDADGVALAEIFTGHAGEHLRVSLAPCIDQDDLHRGDTVVLNTSKAIISVGDHRDYGLLAVVSEVQRDRLVVVSEADTRFVVRATDGLVCKSGDHVMIDPGGHVAFEVIDVSETKRLALESVPDISYDEIGGLGDQVTKIRDSLELPYLHPKLFATMKLSPPKGVLLYGPPGPQPVSAGVLTPSGWTTIGEIKSGDEVIGSDGLSHAVLEVYEYGERPVYEIEFSDGAKTRADGEHSWAVQTKKMRRNPDSERLWGPNGHDYRISQGKRWMTRKTYELVAGKERGVSPDSIPICAPVDFVAQELPLHPYVLGALLGDGSFRSVPKDGFVQFTTSSENFAELVGAHADVHKWHDLQWGVHAGRAIHVLGLAGVHAAGKFIPEEYLCGSLEQRESLLQGLLDSDGRVNEHSHSINWSTTSPVMRDQFLGLIRSLGGTAEIFSEDARKNPCWRIRVALPNSVTPFRREDKQYAAMMSVRGTPIRYVRSVTPDGTEEVKCLLMDSKDHLYVTDDFIVTSNCGKTLIAKAVANSLAKQAQGADATAWFLNVKGPELLNKYVGETERLLREVFAKAREKASEGMPVIIFFDEMDSMFRTRGSGVSSDMESTIVPTILAEIDGVEDLANVIVIGASNREDLIDPGLLRPGRLDIKIKIDRPDQDGSHDIMGLYLTEDLPLDGNIKVMLDDTIARMFRQQEEDKFLEVTYVNGDKQTMFFCDFLSGAMIRNIVDRAKHAAIKRYVSTLVKKDDRITMLITGADMLQAVSDEFKENEDLPNTTNPDDWAKISGKKGERISSVRALRTPEGDGSIERATLTGQFL